MRHVTDMQVLELTSFVGILAGIGLLLPAYVYPELALPACLVLLPSLLYGLR